MFADNLKRERERDREREREREGERERDEGGGGEDCPYPEIISKILLLPLSEHTFHMMRFELHKNC